MSLQEFYVEGGERATLASLKHTGKHILGAAPFYDLIMVNVGEASLGSGSTGTVFHAKLQKRNVVVKLPNTLLDSKHIVLNANGHVTTTPITSARDRKFFEEAQSDLEIEWHNGFLLREGAEIMATGIADPAGVNINESELRWQDKHPVGYNNIHELLGMDASVPCLISAYFEDAVLLWARRVKPTPHFIFHVVEPQVRAGLAYMHNSAGLAHMDIKPYNMLCSHKVSKGQHYLHVVLCDFGATMPSDAPGQSPAGTVGYMAPEVEHAGYIPKFADAYSFAVSILHLLHPSVPCETTQDQPVMLHKILARQCPARLKAIVHEMDPAKRYAMFQSSADIYA